MTSLDDSFSFDNVPDDEPVKKTKKSRAKVGASPLRGGKRDIEEIYQKKTQREHVLLRPDSYIGSIDTIQTNMWVYDEKEGMVFRQIDYIPGLFKIFDEILVNASDNKQRDNSMDTLKVDINDENGSISVWNNGRGIPVTVHQKYNIYVPELIFGHLLTGSNYDDTMKKVTGGRNGYGAKLTNIFSKEFTVSTADGGRKRLFTQRFKKNMTEKSEPVIVPYEGEDFTCVTFFPDLPKFSIDRLSEDMRALFLKRVYDIAGCNPSVKVFYNGSKKRLPVRSFRDYVNLYIPEEKRKSLIFEICGDRWEVAFTLSEGQFQQVSFVNGICTVNGGTHVTHVADLLISHLKETLTKKNKGMAIKPFQMKNHMWLFVRSLIVNPTFDSQTKEVMTLQVSKFGSKCQVSPEFLKKVDKSGVVDAIVSWAKFKENRDLQKKDGKKVVRVLGIPKLDDANDAGKRGASDCTLILTEGDSAKALAVSGLSVIGRDRYGVFPLRGKLLNVRDADVKKVSANEEITNLKRILGLKQATKYDESIASLRYGHVMIMADQDQDGSHIKGLIINFFHAYWPDLVRRPGFLTEFITPIVKVTKGKQTQSFFTLPEYRQWKEAHNNGKGWSVKYYKGLGTSTSSEAKEYFSNLAKHQIDFAHGGVQDDEAIDLAFNKKKADARKEWLRTMKTDTYLDHAVSNISYEKFVNDELILFSAMDNVRSIPALMDGLKPGQRKILFSCFKRNLKDEIKVAQLAGYVGEHSAYHHGEAALAGTIVNMAQDFVGSNNVNLLAPEGQFGTRLQGGKDAASPRYIHTRLMPTTRLLFHQQDDPLLKYLDDDGLSIEPVWYVPVIPMVLVNGADGIGTGWSTSIPNYNPIDVARNCMRVMDSQPCIPMVPWYRGFQGTIEAVPGKPGSFHVTGSWERLDEGTIEISELPIRTWTQSYKEFLESLIPGASTTANDKDKAKGAAAAKKPKHPGEELHIVEFREHHTTERVLFTVSFEPDRLDALINLGLEKKMKLTTTIGTSNMNLYDSRGRIRLYRTPEEILEEFCGVRLRVYGERKLHVMNQLDREVSKLENQARFISEVISNVIPISRKSTADLIALLVEGKYKSIPPRDTEKGNKEEGEEVETPKDSKPHFEYLLNMSMGSMTTDRVAELLRQCDKKRGELLEVASKTEKSMWKEDLQEFLKSLEEDTQRRERIQAEEASMGRKSNPKRTVKRPTAKKIAMPVFDSESVFDEVDSISPPLSSLPSAIPSKAAVKATARPVLSFAKPKPVKKKRSAASRTSDVMSSSDELDDDESDYKPTPKAPKRPIVKSAAARAVKIESPPSVETTPTKSGAKAKAKPRARAPAGAKKKKAFVVSDTDDSFVAPDDDSEMSEFVPTPQKPKPKKAPRKAGGSSTAQPKRSKKGSGESIVSAASSSAASSLPEGKRSLFDRANANLLMSSTPSEDPFAFPSSSSASAVTAQSPPQSSTPQRTKGKSAATKRARPVTKKQPLSSARQPKAISAKGKPARRKLGVDESGSSEEDKETIRSAKKARPQRKREAVSYTDSAFVADESGSDYVPE